MRRYKKLLIALAAIANIYIVKATGLDGGLIDDALRAGVDAVTEPEPPPAPVAPAVIEPEKETKDQ